MAMMRWMNGLVSWQHLHLSSSLLMGFCLHKEASIRLIELHKSHSRQHIDPAGM